LFDNDRFWHSHWQMSYISRLRGAIKGFHPIPLGVSGKRREGNKKKKGKREKLWKIKYILFALLNPSYAVIHTLISRKNNLIISIRNSLIKV
jgi:hypothetical protein